MAHMEIVYFIGAGLSKSLERPGKPIPLMYDFVSVMAEYAPHDKVILHTLARLEHAGVFRWPSAEAAGLANSLIKDKADPTRDTLVRFSEAMKRRPAESIEELLLAALRMAEQPAPSASELPAWFSSDAPDQFRHAISRLFGKWIGWEVDWCPLEAFLSHQFESYPLQTCKHTFISFNYDLLLDSAIQRIARDGHHPDKPSWHPSTGYGFEVSYYVGDPEQLPCPTVSGGLVYGGSTERNEAHPLSPQPSANILVIKPHGSLNWIIRHSKIHDSGKAGLLIDFNTPILLPLKDGKFLDYWRAERQECANIFYNPQSATDLAEVHASIFLMPPTPESKKIRAAFMTKVREAEKAALREADEVFVVGWSMPVSDLDQICSIRSCIAERDKPLDSVTVINRGEHPEYFERIADTFGIAQSALRVFNNGFSDFVRHATEEVSAS